MSVIEDISFEESFDRTFFDLSAKAARPLYWGAEVLRYRLFSPLDPGKFGNASTNMEEVANRVLIAATTILTLLFAGTHLVLAASVLVLGSVLLKAAAISFQKNQFTYVKGGLLQEKSIENRTSSIMLWNLMGFCYEEGLPPWTARIDKIVEKAKQEDPDTVVFRSVNDTAFKEALIEKFGENYAHIFTHFGKGFMGEANGCIIFTKCGVHDLSHEEFSTTSLFEGRGFELLELKENPEAKEPFVRIVTASLQEGKSHHKERISQFNQIVGSLSQKKTSPPTFFVGNFSCYKGKNSGKNFLSKYLYSSDRKEAPTYTRELANQWQKSAEKLEDKQDFVSLFKRSVPNFTLAVTERGVHLKDCHLVEAFKENPQEALSSHHGIFAEIEFPICKAKEG